VGSAKLCPGGDCSARIVKDSRGRPYLITPDGVFEYMPGDPNRDRYEKTASGIKVTADPGIWVPVDTGSTSYAGVAALAAVLDGPEPGPMDLIALGILGFGIMQASSIKETNEYLSKETGNFYDHLQWTYPSHNSDPGNRNKWTRDLKNKIQNMKDVLKRLPQKGQDFWKFIIEGMEQSLPPQ
jgi:hypothetical protein